MKKRSKILIVLGVLLCLMAVGGTLAYLSDHGGKRTNKITFGNVTIDVVETFNPPSSLKVGDNTYEKRVTFKNNGTIPAYARTLLAFSEADVADISKLSSDGGNTWYSVSEFKNHLPSGWAYEGTGALGGYYYYTSPLAPGQSTTPLITNVKTTFQNKTADTNYTINYTPRNYDIYVYVEGVQQMKLDGSALNTNYRNAWTQFLDLK